MKFLRRLVKNLSSGLARTPKNTFAHTYVIEDFEGNPYITRTLLPRLAGRRLLLHKIHREDRDRHLHNHPWATAKFLIVSGGYREERLMPDGSLKYTTYMPGDVNELTADTFHRVTEVADDTWTIGLVGERVQDWGFLVDDEVVPHTEYFARHRYVSAGINS